MFMGNYKNIHVPYVTVTNTFLRDLILRSLHCTKSEYVYMYTLYMIIQCRLHGVKFIVNGCHKIMSNETVLKKWLIHVVIMKGLLSQAGNLIFLNFR